MVAIKLAIVLVVIFVGFAYIVPANHAPFIPPNTGTFGHFGWTGVFRATGVIFFAYIGFDACQRGGAGGQESAARHSHRHTGLAGPLHRSLHADVVCADRHRAIITTLTSPIRSARRSKRCPPPRWLAPYVNIGAVVGLASVVLVLLLGQSRIFYAMARDGMIPPPFTQIHPRFPTPWKGIDHHRRFLRRSWRAFCRSIFWANWFPSARWSAFVIVCVGVMVLRVRAPACQAAVPHAVGLGHRAAGHLHVRVHDGLPAARHLAAAWRCGQ